MENEVKYSELSKFEKFESVTMHHWSGLTRHYAAKYLKALWLNDKATQEEFEKLGDDPRYFIDNKTAHEYCKFFGYSKIEINEYGWFIEPKFNEVERIDLGSDNYILIGNVNNDVYTYSLCLASSFTCGRSGPLSVYGERFTTARAAAIKAINATIEWHNKEYGFKSKSVIEFAEKQLDILLERGQLSLF